MLYSLEFRMTKFPLIPHLHFFDRCSKKFSLSSKCRFSHASYTKKKREDGMKKVYSSDLKGSIVQ